jgi:hypothetical protein
MINLYEIPITIEESTQSEPKKTSKTNMGNANKKQPKSKREISINAYVNKGKSFSDKTFVERAPNFTKAQIDEALKLREVLKKKMSQEKVKMDRELEQFRTSMKNFLQSEEIFKVLFKYQKKQTLMLKSTLDNKYYKYIYELKPR